MLAKAIEAYLTERIANLKPCQWKAKEADILAKIARAKEAQLKQATSMTGD